MSVIVTVRRYMSSVRTLPPGTREYWPGGAPQLADGRKGYRTVERVDRVAPGLWEVTYLEPTAQGRTTSHIRRGDPVDVLVFGR